MASKFKSILKRQASQPPVRKNANNAEESSVIKQEMKNVKVDYFRGRTDEKTTSPADAPENGQSENSAVLLLRRKNGIRRHNTSLGAIEDLLQCPICKERLKSPRMMPCQHTFCQECLEKQIMTKSSSDDTDKFDDVVLACPLCNLRVTDRTPDLLPTNLYIESLLRVIEHPGDGWLRLASKNPVVSFAPLPERICKLNDNETAPGSLAISSSSWTTSLCYKCSIACARHDRCKHCKQYFCAKCWTPHIDELKEQMEKIVPQMETTSRRILKKMDEFRAKVDDFKDSIEKDVEAKIAELMQERETRIERLSYRSDRGEETAREIQHRMIEVSERVEQQTNGLYETLDNNDAKVKVFMALHREATDLMYLESTWNPELGELDNAANKSKTINVDFMSVRGDVELFYRRKIFSSKFIVDRELVQRPSGMSHDPWRDHVFVACPGTRQIVVLDRKYKLFKRYQSKEMMSPHGVAYVESTEQLFVTDKWKHCIFVFNRNGEVVRQMWKKGQAESQLSSPEGLTFHPLNNLLYVADTGNDRIQILELDGTFRGSIGSAERYAKGVTKTGKVTSIGVNHLNQPTAVAVTDDRVIVADCGNHKVKIFNHGGVLVHTLGGSGTLRRHFRSPEVVVVDNRGNIIVGDSGNARIQIFSPQGELLRVLGGRSAKSNKFGWISGLLVKNNFDIMIGDNKNNAIRIF